MSAVRNAGAPGAGPASLVAEAAGALPPVPRRRHRGRLREDRVRPARLGAANSASASSRCPRPTVTTGLPRLTPREAHAQGARSIVIGVANTGGVLKPSWIPSLVDALEAGLDIVSGMHGKLAAIPRAEGGGRPARPAADRRAPAAAGHPDRHRPQAHRQAPARRSAPTARSARNIRRSRSRARCAGAASTRISAPPARPGS